MTNNIFQDLQIDYSNMMNEPQDFHANCVREADKLREILKADISPESILKGIVADNPLDEDQVKANAAEIHRIYESVDKTFTIPEMLDFAERLRKLAKDVEYLARDKVMLKMSENSEGQIDKALAWELYQELRKRHNDWLGGMEMLAGFDAEMKSKVVDIEKIPGLPGNYSKGPQVLNHYIFRIEGDEDIFRTSHGVLYELNKRNGTELNVFMTLMDAVEMFRENFDTYQVHVTGRDN